MAWRPSGGMRENPWLPNNSFSNEVITTCQCNATVQRPSLCEPRIVTAVKRLLQNSKVLGCKNVRTEVADFRKAVKSSICLDLTQIDSSLYWQNSAQTRCLHQQGSHPALVPAKYVIPLSSKAVNEVVVPRVSVKGIMTELAHVKPVPKFPYALQ